MSTPWFFLSYARVDSVGNTQLPEFYKDLVREIRRMAGLKGAKDSEIGFFDASGIETGLFWREQLSSALQTCRVLVCLYSQGYFNSEYCGKEFHVFRSRVDNYLKNSPESTQSPPLILPVLWDRPSRLPAPLPQAVSEIQYSDAEFGETYAKEGLYFLMKVSKFRSEYEEFLLKFADKIFQAGRTDVLRPLPNLPDIRKVKNAFQHKEPSSTEALSLNKHAFLRVAQFVYVAGNSAELKDVRDNVTCYMERGGREWQPYYPEVLKSIGIISQAVATRENLQYETYQVSENLMEALRAAEEANSIVVIVVDPWSIKVKSYRKHMLDFDGIDFLNCRVLIPWNGKDEETSKRLGELRANVQITFTRKLILKTYIKESISSIDELEREISVSINEIRRRLLLKAEVHGLVENTGTAMPSISVPAGAST